MFHVIAVNDFASASMAAFGVIAALNARERTGKGQVMETSLTAQSAMFQSGELTTWPGAPTAPKGCRDCLGIAALDRFYACADAWVAVACGGADEAAALAAALGHPDWVERFDMLGEPRDGALAGELAAALGAMPSADALTALLGAGVRAAPVREGEEILGDPWLWANDFFDQPRQTPHGPVVNRPYAEVLPQRERLPPPRPRPRRAHLRGAGRLRDRAGPYRRAVGGRCGAVPELMSRPRVLPFQRGGTLVREQRAGAFVSGAD